TTAEALRRQLKDEQHSRTVLQARIAGDSAELQKLQLDSKKKKLKISKKADETDKVVNLVSQQVEQLKKVYNDKTKRIAKLEEQISLFKNKHRETKEHLAKKKEELEPEHKHVKEENLNKTKRLDYMKHRTEVIDKKMEEMDSSSVIMKKVLSNTENDILELSAEMGEMAIRLETGQKMHDDLKIALEEVEKRSEEQACQHENHLKERQIVLNDLEAQLEKKLEENERLAHQYRYLQDKVIATKDKLMNEFDGKIKFESSLKDHKQLNGLQSRLHASLAIYYKIRGLYNQAELAKFEAVSQKNGQRIHILQVDMDEAISTIALFLNDQIDGTAAQMVAAAAKSALFENSDPIPQTKKLKSALKKPVST
ncbi:coiled-coil domain-containing protein 178-like, partial [Saccoglossus kowalevskii]|uniref:Coiled-coil domain-containing protein 178-like n=1 Tax=Saccoglossus kowalevskii TaxID=10224 RepID=A0ABM0GP88_SACKO